MSKPLILKKNAKINTEFAIDVKAENPNGNIGFEYEKNSAVDMIYSGSQLCYGRIPSFVQAGKNTTRINVVLKGQSNFRAKMQHDLLQNRKTGKVPLKVRIPITVVLHGICLREYVVSVQAYLVIDNLQPNGKVKILESTYEYEVQF